MSVALEPSAAFQPKVSFDHAAVVKYLVGTRDGGCGCWKEYGIGNIVGVSSWAMFALAKIRAPSEQPQPDELKFVLEAQKQDGSWAITPDTSNNPRDSATYATSWSVLVLDEYRRIGRVVSQQKEIDLAIGRGGQYLLSVMITDKARWADYPKSDDGIESISDSGLALHVLHRLDLVADPYIDRLWLRRLPPGGIALAEAESSGHRVQLANLNHSPDGIRRYKLPWTMIAIRDAYANGTNQDQLAAQQWLEKLLANATEMQKAVRPHVAAELLIAMRYLDGEKDLL
jgi:hypothetical protein